MEPQLIKPPEERFADNAKILADALHNGIKKLYNNGYKVVDPKIVEVASGLISTFDKDYLISGFIENTHEYWDKVKLRDERFFIENSGEVFRYLPIDKVNLFRDLFMMKDKNGISVVSEENKEQIWDIFCAMVKISIKYIHSKRDPYSYMEGGSINYAYGVSFYPDIDLNHHSKNWKIQLDFPLQE